MANSPSVLVGLLKDAAGNRFTPSHTLKKGRRYRYYVCQPVADGSEAQNKPIRLPAHNVEQQVALRLQSFLQSGKGVMDELSLSDDPAARTQQLMAGATKQYRQLSSASPKVVKDFVREVVRRVVVHPDRIHVEVSKPELRAALLGDPNGLCNPSEKQGESRDNVIHLAIEARVKRCGLEMRLVFPPDRDGQQVPSHPASSLLKALARGRTWHGWILAGKDSGASPIAQKLNLNERYVRRVLQCAFLAPDIVEAILDGRQPSDLTFGKLTRRLPLSWIDQRRHLGFPSLQHTQ
jgi:site-specific DNA recombinase